MSDYIAAYKKWLKNVIDSDLLKELKSIENDDVQIKNRFYKELEFGTGGLRGIIGAGTNCLNIYTIRKATAGLCEYIKENGGKSAAISYDSRINSQLFAITAAEVFAGCGIKAYITKELMPTPFLSFAVRHLKADVGVMITASHNPAAYNGYKVYGNDGCQITDSYANAVTEKINKTDAFEVKTQSFENYLKSGMIEYIGQSVKREFLKCAAACAINDIGDIKICYTPLNGTGYKLVPEILKMRGARGIVAVKEQSYPDGSFKTCPYPNPEKAEALKLGLEKAAKENCDILLATDPDADRVGVAVFDGGVFKLLSGNEMGILLAEYLLSQKLKNGTLPDSPLIIKTIVTTKLADKIAAAYNAQVTDTLTGFKYIGEQIGILEKNGEENRFVLGFEESYGYLAGSYVRDKDAVGACMLIAEMAQYYKQQGKTLADVLKEIYSEYGKYQHKLTAREFAGADGAKKSKSLLDKVRTTDFKSIGGIRVTGFTDYLTQTKNNLPKANVLVYDLDNGAQLIIRPSGTEPLIKFYMTAALNDQKNEEIFCRLSGFIDEHFT
ncbi:MAG: phospho-sugar mutase [Clostridia bacterium]|nr:phospho-sugar mutase [Clostridia bacterium]